MDRPSIFETFHNQSIGLQRCFNMLLSWIQERLSTYNIPGINSFDEPCCMSTYLRTYYLKNQSYHKLKWLTRECSLITLELEDRPVKVELIESSSLLSIQFFLGFLFFCLNGSLISGYKSPSNFPHTKIWNQAHSNLKRLLNVNLEEFYQKWS